MLRDELLQLSTQHDDAQCTAFHLFIQITRKQLSTCTIMRAEVDNGGTSMTKIKQDLKIVSHWP
jgi:hypothetical protein